MAKTAKLETTEHKVNIAWNILIPVCFFQLNSIFVYYGFAYFKSSGNEKNKIGKIYHIISTRTSSLPCKVSNTVCKHSNYYWNKCKWRNKDIQYRCWNQLFSHFHHHLWIRPMCIKRLTYYIISARISQAFFNKNSCNIEIAIVQFVEMHIEPFYHTLIYIIHYY